MPAGEASGSARAKKQSATKASKGTAGKSMASAAGVPRSSSALDADAAHQLAGKAAEQSEKLYAAARSLHDDVGPLLATAGLKLQLLEFDSTEETGPVDEVLELLGDAMERVRRLSQDLYASTVDRIGLKRALERIAEQHAGVSIHYSATARPEARMAAQLFETAEAAMEAALGAGAKTIQVNVTGAAGLHIKVTDDGISGDGVDNASGAKREDVLRVSQMLAERAGISVEISTSDSPKTGTIVSIRYVSRRTDR